MGLQLGIVGLPNVGKSSLFNVMTSGKAEASNYPFCTIDPNVGVVAVPDERLDFIYEVTKPAKKVPTTVEFVDIAGLVQGANKNEGLGNQFLSHIREVDAVTHVVRLFSDSDIVHVGDIDPVGDLKTIETELALKDLDSLDKRKEKLIKRVRSQSDKEAQRESDMVEWLSSQVAEGKMVHELLPELQKEDRQLVRSFFLLTAKPALVIVNMDEDMDMGSERYHQLNQYCDMKGYPLVPISVKLEAEINDLPQEERQDFMRDFGLESSGLDRLIRTGYELLNLETFFTAGGPTEARAWTVPQNTSAPKAAGVIHSDFEKGFIKAEVLSYKDFVKYQDFTKAKEAGRLRLEGKDYIVQDGDIIEFRFNV